MQLKPVIVALVLLAFPLGAAAQTTTVPNSTYAAGTSPVVVLGPTNVTTGNSTVTVSSGATVIYQANSSVILKPGFRAAVGGKFYAVISSTLDTDSDGLPDIWERANGLNPANAGDATNSAPNGLTYLNTYQLGMNVVTNAQPDNGNTSQLKINRPTV